MPDELDRFDQALREWAGRPPRRSPKEAAATVLEALRADQRRRATRWSALASAAALVLAVTAALMWPTRGHREILVAAAPDIVTNVTDGVVLMWLDEETPLYMTFHQPGGGAGTEGAAQ